MSPLQNDQDCPTVRLIGHGVYGTVLYCTVCGRHGYPDAHRSGELQTKPKQSFSLRLARVELLGRAGLHGESSGGPPFVTWDIGEWTYSVLWYNCCTLWNLNQMPPSRFAARIDRTVVAWPTSGGCGTCIVRSAKGVAAWCCGVAEGNRQSPKRQVGPGIF